MHRTPFQYACCCRYISFGMEASNEPTIIHSRFQFQFFQCRLLLFRQLLLFMFRLLHRPLRRLFGRRRRRHQIVVYFRIGSRSLPSLDPNITDIPTIQSELCTSLSQSIHPCWIIIHRLRSFPINQSISHRQRRSERLGKVVAVSIGQVIACPVKRYP